MLDCMRAPILLLAAFALALPAIPGRAQDSARASIVQAYQLWRKVSQGGGCDSRALVAADTQTFTEEQLGAAWDLLGSSYQDLEIFDRARQAYGKAIEMLRSIPSAQAQYAAAIDNLASMDRRWGQKDSAMALCEKSRRIYEHSETLRGLPLHPPISLCLRARRISRRRDARWRQPSRKRRPPPD